MATLLRRRSVLAAKVEATPGTAESLTTAEAAFHVFDISIDADIPMKERESQGSMSMLPAIPGAMKGSVSFYCELHGDGTSGAPAWAETFLLGCGMVQSSEAFTLTSVSGSMKTLTIGVYRDGLFKKLAGAMGTWTIEATDGEPVMIKFDFQGVWTAPTDVAMITPNYQDVIPPVFKGSTFTIGSYNPKMSKYSLALNNQIKMREDITHASGYSTALITNRNPSGSFNPEADLVANINVFGIWLAGTQAALSTAVGSATGNIITIAAPKLQYHRVSEESDEDLMRHPVEFKCHKSADAGDDELSITFS